MSDQAVKGVRLKSVITGEDVSDFISETMREAGASLILEYRETLDAHSLAVEVYLAMKKAQASA